jgi:hypothetical protein
MVDWDRGLPALPVAGRVRGREGPTETSRFEPRTVKGDNVAATRTPKRTMSPAQVEAMFALERRVLELRTTGKSFYAINREIGIQNSHQVFKRAINRDDNAEFRRAEALRLEEARLDALQEGIWTKALNGDARAVEVAIKVLERRSRLLGLDFADVAAGRLVEIESWKVEMMTVALGEMLAHIGLPAATQREGIAFFLNKIRALPSAPLPANETDTVDAEVVLDEDDMALL